MIAHNIFMTKKKYQLQQHVDQPYIACVLFGVAAVSHWGKRHKWFKSAEENKKNAVKQINWPNAIELCAYFNFVL